MTMHDSKRPERLTSHNDSELGAKQPAMRGTSLESPKLWNCFLAVTLLILTAPFLLISDDVLQHHLNGSRNGLYVDPLITRKTATTTHRDNTFNASLPGPVYAQPLYARNGPGGKPAFIVATEQNEILALDATTGSQIWRRRVGNPVSRSRLPCGDIDPLGITGTPVIDPNARNIYVAAMTTPDGGKTKQHLVFALSLDDGSMRPGWLLNLTETKYGEASFNPAVQNQRGALLLNSGILYVPYGGHFGDCGDYRGWVIAVPVGDPKSLTAWATGARAGGGIWAPNGVATDGQSVFIATGNTFGARTWMGGEAIIRLGPGAQFSGSPMDYFTPSNWRKLDGGDVDLGGSGPVLIDVPGATPAQLVIALGKNGVAYLLDRNNLGGIGKGDGIHGEGVQSKRVATDRIINAAASYRTASSTFVIFETKGTGIGCPGRSGNLVALRIGASAPPTIDVAWCADNGGRGSPIVTTTDGSSEPVVWAVGSESNNRLHAFNGVTGEVLFAGGGQDERMSMVRRFQTPIVVNGRIFVAADDNLYSFVTR
jgi:PQQ enzyme-like repeat protein